MLPSLSQILIKGAPGGHSFAHIVKMLLVADEQNGGSTVKIFNDCSGDIDGADAILENPLGKTYLQIKFYPSKLSSPHKTSIQNDYKKVASSLGEEDKWVLVTPDDLHADEIKWFEEKFGERAFHIGYTRLAEWFLKYPHIGRSAYPNHEFRHYAKEFIYPKEPEKFFEKFISSKDQAFQLLQGSYPSLYDCRMAFAEEWAELMYLYYKEHEPFFNNPDSHYDFNGFKAVRCELRNQDRISQEQLAYPALSNSKEDISPSEDILRQDIPLYKVSFLREKDAPFGVSYKNWAFINQRWVFFGKVNRAIISINSIRADPDFKRIVRISNWMLKRTGYRGKLSQRSEAEARLAVSLMTNAILGNQSQKKS